MRKLTKLALGTITGIIAGATAVKLSRNITEYQSGKYSEGLPPGFVWMDGMDLDNSDIHPYFDVGDSVIIVNPNTGGIWGGISAMKSPLIFKVTDAKYDDEDVEWRYKLKPRDVSEDECGLECDLATHWFAENWLDVADMPSMARVMDVTEKPDNKLAEVGADMLASLEVDYLLDTLNWSSDEKERNQAEIRLKEIAEGDE